MIRPSRRHLSSRVREPLRASATSADRDFFGHRAIEGIDARRARALAIEAHARFAVAMQGQAREPVAPGPAGAAIAPALIFPALDFPAPAAPPAPKPAAREKRAEFCDGLRARLAARPIPPPGRFEFLDLHDGVCRFPVTEDRPFRFCGRPTRRTYCARHDRIAHPICESEEG